MGPDLELGTGGDVVRDGAADEEVGAHPPKVEGRPAVHASPSQELLGRAGIGLRREVDVVLRRHHRSHLGHAGDAELAQESRQVVRAVEAAPALGLLQQVGLLAQGGAEHQRRGVVDHRQRLTDQPIHLSVPVGHRVREASPLGRVRLHGEGRGPCGASTRAGSARSCSRSRWRAAVGRDASGAGTRPTGSDRAVPPAASAPGDATALPRAARPPPRRFGVTGRAGP